MKVLVVEDTVTSAMLVCHLLRKMGLEPFHVKDGEAGIAAFRREKPDLVLLDIIMPGMDGFEVAKRIRQLERNGEWTPIIFLTARTGDDDLERGIHAGGDDYLVKPVSEVVLSAKIRAMQRIAQMRYSLLVLTRKLDEANHELRRLSAADGLTGIANRRQFDETMAKEWRRAARLGLPLSVLLMDVDFFKPFNDNYGHQVGDECLKAIATNVEATLKRPTDLVARFGGEEFVVLLPQTDVDGARQVAEGIRESIQALKISHRYSAAAPVVTISIGLATAWPVRDGPAPEALIADADAALYEAKRQGRNRVCMAGVGEENLHAVSADPASA